MIYIIFILHLFILILFFISVTIFKSSSTNLLLLMVCLVFFNGLILINLGNSLLGIYLIIIYIGAIVILFSFCILFLNLKEVKILPKLGLKKFSYLCSILLIVWEMLNIFNFYIPKSNDLNNIFFILNEFNYLFFFSQIIFISLIIPLIMIIKLLIMGIYITLKIMKN